MCGRYALGLGSVALEELFEVVDNKFPDWTPRWNIAPTTTVPLVMERLNTSGEPERVLGPARWSLTPPWSDTLDTPYPTFNARSETAATKPTFRQAVKHSRAIVPASGYFEWHTQGRVKTPHYIHPPHASVWGLAGLFSLWSDGSHSLVTATILTREAPAALEWIHPRSPIALAPEDWSAWLDPRVEGTQTLIDDASERSERVYATAREHAVLPLRGDGPELIAPRLDQALTD